MTKNVKKSAKNVAVAAKYEICGKIAQLLETKRTWLRAKTLALNEDDLQSYTATIKQKKNKATKEEFFRVYITQLLEDGNRIAVDFIPDAGLIKTIEEDEDLLELAKSKEGIHLQLDTVRTFLLVNKDTKEVLKERRATGKPINPNEIPF